MRSATRKTASRKWSRTSPITATLVNDLFLRFLNRPGKPEEVDAATQMFEQLEADHAKLVAEVGSLREGTCAEVAEREIERQGRVAGLQAEIEAHRDIVKLRRPQRNASRHERVAKAQAALAEYDKQLAGEAAEVGSRRRRRRRAGSRSMPPRWVRRYPARSSRSRRTVRSSSRATKRKAPIASRRRFRSIASREFGWKRWPTIGCPTAARVGPAAETSSSPSSTARWLPASGPQKLVRSWDFSGADDGWQTEEGAKVVADSGTRHLFGTGQPAGIKTTLKEPAGTYLLEVVTGIRSASTFTVQWTTAKEPTFDSGTLGAADAAAPVTAAAP